MRNQIWSVLTVLLTVPVCPILVGAADWSLSGNPELAAFFNSEVLKIEQRNELTRYQTLEEWQQARPVLRKQLFEMMGLDPLPEKTPLQVAITGTEETDEFRVERLTFQSLPGLYVTGNLYLPKTAPGPLPAVLYVCGHGNVRVGDVSYGSKVSYQRHGGWFARNGYVCLVIDTLQLGEIEGIHHGTYRYNRWWWNSRGYTPAGVEAWNCIRALDFLQSRPEVDGTRLGVTGRSGGGAYSWWISALDDRIQCAVPVAGITSMRNHVVDGCVEGHCDCMYFVNTRGWDYAVVAALVAPRPLLISNTDKDTIFPLEGVVDIHRQARHIYRLYEKPEHLGLQITEGPHKDTQELHVHAFRWMNRFLRHDDSMVTHLVQNFFEPEQLKVFSTLPADERNTAIDQTFVPDRSQPSPAEDSKILADTPEWERTLQDVLRKQCFAAWPDSDPDWHPAAVTTEQKMAGAGFWSATFPSHAVVRLSFESQPHVPLQLDIIHPSATPLSEIKAMHLVVTDDLAWAAYEKLRTADGSAPPAAKRERAGQENDDTPAGPSAANVSALFERLQSLLKQPGTAVAIFSPRGMGLDHWVGDEKKQTQILRRFMLLGMTADGMRTWDIRRAMQVLRERTPKDCTLSLQTAGLSDMAILYAALFEPNSCHLILDAASLDGIEHPWTILNQQRWVHEQEIAALALRQHNITIRGDAPAMGLAQRLASSPQWTGGTLTQLTQP